MRPKLHELCLAQSLRVPFFTHPRRVFCVKITCARAPRCEYARRAWVTMASWSSLSRWESSARMRTAQCENFSSSRARGRKPVRRSRRSCGPRLRPVHGATCRTSTSRSKRASSTRRDRAAPRLRLCHRTNGPVQRVLALPPLDLQLEPKPSASTARMAGDPVQRATATTTSPPPLPPLPPLW